MTEQANARTRARLDELAAVTKEYATYSRSAYGVAAVAAGALMCAGVASDLAWRAAWTSTTYYFIVPTWFVAGRLARRHYQRHGAVVERDRGIGRQRRSVIASVYVYAVLNVFLIARAGIELGAAGWPKLVAIAAVVAVPLLAAEWVSSQSDAMVTTLLFAVTFVAIGRVGTERHVEWALGAVLLAVLGGAMLVVGAREHLRYRGLERRLAALKGSAP